MDSETAPEPVRMLAPPGSRLEELLASYEGARASAQEAADRLKAVTTAIKAELTASAPGCPVIQLDGAPGLPRLRLTWRTQWKFNVRKFKADCPELYVKYGHSAGHWDLRQTEE